MNYYELTYIFSPTLSEEQSVTFQEKVGEMIQGFDGTPIEMKPVTRRKLCYEIEKQTEAYLGVIVFKMEAEKAPLLNKKIKEDKTIIRHLLLRKEEERKVAKPPRRAPRAEKSDLEDLDKKIEEILK